MVFSIIVLFCEWFLIPSVYAADAIVWQPYELDYEGPYMDESESNPNPFLDFRLQVIFVGPNGQVYDVPGFFAGNGEGEGKGNVWRAIFTFSQRFCHWKY